MGGGTTDVNYPGPTAQETELEQMQLDGLKQQKELVAGFTPFILDQYGLKSVDKQVAASGRGAELYQQAQARRNLVAGADPNSLIKDPYSGAMEHPGTIIAAAQAQEAELQKMGVDPTTGMQKSTSYEYTPEQQAKNAQLRQLQEQALTLQGKQSQRISDAMDGKLSASAALTNQQTKDFAVLKENQGRLGNEIIGDSLDNATAKTTSGIQALEGLRQTYGSLKSQEMDNIIRGEAQNPGVYQSQYQGSAPTTASAALGGLVNPLSVLNGQYSSAYQPYQVQAQGQYAAGAQTAQNRTNMLTGLIGGGAQAGSMALMSMMSSTTFKKNISTMTIEDEEALASRLLGTPVHRYHYKTEEDSIPRHVGFVTEEAPPEIVTEDGKHLSVVDYFGAVTVLLKVLHRKIDDLAAKAGK